MKEIDDIVQLYEAVKAEAGMKYYFRALTPVIRNWEPYIFRTLIGPYTIKFGNKFHYELLYIWETKDFRGSYKEIEPPMEIYGIISPKEMPYLLEIDYKDIDTIVQQKVYTLEQCNEVIKKRKTIEAIKSPDSTMMDVLCAFGDL